MPFIYTYMFPEKDAIQQALKAAQQACREEGTKFTVSPDGMSGTIDKGGMGTWLKATFKAEGNAVVISGDKGIVVTESRLLKELDSWMAGNGGKRLM